MAASLGHRPPRGALVWLSALAALAPLASPTAASAQAAEIAPADAARARALFDEGLALADRGDHEAAVERFRSSLALVERPSTLFNLGVALRELRREREAIDALERFLVLADASFDEVPRAQARSWIASLRRALAERGGTLVLEVEPADAQVRVDGFDVSGESPIVLDLASGDHEVAITAEGLGSARFGVTLEPGGRETRRVSLEAPGRGDPGEPLRLAGIVALGAATAALGAAITATVVREDLVAQYHGDACAPTTWGTRRDTCPERRADIETTTGLAVGAWVGAAALAGAGVALILLAPTEAPAALACAPALSDQPGIACSGRF